MALHGWSRFQAPWTGPLQPEPQQAKRVMETRRVKYREAGKGFAEWLQRKSANPSHPYEWDDLLIEFSNDRRRTNALTRSQFIELVAVSSSSFLI